jgi:hypothetical protein
VDVFPEKMYFPKADHICFDGNKVTFLEHDSRLPSGGTLGGYLDNETIAELPMIPLLTYEFLD